MFSVLGNWRAEGKVYFVKVSNTGCNGAKINRHNHAFLNRPFSTILFSHWQSTSNYPHEYGEYSFWDWFKVYQSESPPWVWGVRKNVCVTLLRVRMTPMCMGSTTLPVLSEGYSQNHPHVYGEYFSNPSAILHVIESPPWVWGVLIPSTQGTNGFRITPMCMGSTNTPSFVLLLA